MGIEDLRQRIFRKNEDFSKRFKEPTLEKHRDKVSSSWFRGAEGEESETKEDVPKEELPKDSSLTKKVLWWGIGGGLTALFAAMAVFFIFFSGWAGFGGEADTRARIHMNVYGAEEVIAGKQASWRVEFKNNNEIPLEDVVLVFKFPDGSQPLVGEFSKTGMQQEKREIGVIQPGESGEQIFSGMVFGPKDEMLRGTVSLEYRPQNSSAHFSKDYEYSSHIQGTLLGLSLEVPEGLKGGQEVEIRLRVTSSAETAFRGLYAGIQYPASFEYTESRPVPESSNNVWFLGDLPAGSEQVITIKGKIKKSENTETFHAQVGLFDQDRQSWASFNRTSEPLAIASSLLTIGLTTQGGEISPEVTTAGNQLNILVRWKNNLPVAVHDVTLQVALEGDALDLTTLESREGEFDGNLGAVVWAPGRAPGLRVLEPGSEGVFDFSVTLKKDIPITTPENKNFTIQLKGKIFSNEVPQGFEGVDVSGTTEKQYKVATKVSFTQSGYYFDSRIKNTGPIPPRVGEETTYLIVWSIVNTVSDLDNVTVRATLPSYISWKNAIVPPGEKISYKPSTGELIWSPGKIPAGVGYLEPAREVAFQIGLTPTPPQTNKTPQLISTARMEARDIFTDTAFSKTDDQITTNLRDDSQVINLGGSVR